MRRGPKEKVGTAKELVQTQARILKTRKELIEQKGYFEYKNYSEYVRWLIAKDLKRRKLIKRNEAC